MVIDIRAHPFAHTVFGVVAPTTEQWIQGMDDGFRCGADVGVQPRADVRQAGATLVLLWQGVAASLELADLEAKEIGSLAHLGDVGVLRVQCSPSFRKPSHVGGDHRFAILFRAGRHEEVVGIADTSVPIRPCPADLLATIGLGVGIFLHLAVCRQQCIQTVERDMCQQRGPYTSYNVAKNVVEFSTSIPREQLRPGYGAGFLGAPLRMVKPDDIPTERERGGRHGTSSTEHDPGAGGQRPV